MQKVLRPTLMVPFAAGLVVGAMLIGGAGAALLGSGIFDDVQSGSFYDQAVGEMYGLGVIKGYDSRHFGPDDYVTRGQLAVMLKRLRDEMNGVTPGSSGTQSSRARSSAAAASSVSSQATVTSAGGFRFAATAFSIPDVAPQVTISVVRSGGSRGEAVVAYSFSGGTAIAGTDYTPTNGVLTFGDGETTKNITGRLIRNTGATGHRTINITLKNPTGGAVLLDPSSAVVTLLKSGVSIGSSSSSAAAGAATSAPGGIIAFSASAFSVLENAGTSTITVTRSGNSASAVSVDFTMEDGSAMNGVEYEKNSGTLSFAANETTKTFTVQVYDDGNTVNGSKSATLVLRNATGNAALGTPATATLTILDNESFTSGSGSIRFAVSEYTVKHSDGAVYVAVNRGGSVTGTATVRYETIDSSAHNGGDYTRVTGTLTFTGNETQKLITIPLITRTMGGDGDKTFTVRLNDVTGNATMGTLFETAVTITD